MLTRFPNVFGASIMNPRQLFIAIRDNLTPRTSCLLVRISEGLASKVRDTMGYKLPQHKMPSTAAQPAGLELSCGLPPRAALAFKNLRDVTDCMSQAVTSSTLSLTTAQMRVHNAQTWLVMTPAAMPTRWELPAPLAILRMRGEHGACFGLSCATVRGARWWLGIRR